MLFRRLLRKVDHRTIGAPHLLQPEFWQNVAQLVAQARELTAGDAFLKVDLMRPMPEFVADLFGLIQAGIERVHLLLALGQEGPSARHLVVGIDL